MWCDRLFKIQRVLNSKNLNIFWVVYLWLGTSFMIGNSSELRNYKTDKLLNWDVTLIYDIYAWVLRPYLGSHLWQKVFLPPPIQPSNDPIIIHRLQSRHLLSLCIHIHLPAPHSVPNHKVKDIHIHIRIHGRIYWAYIDVLWDIYSYIYACMLGIKPQQRVKVSKVCTKNKR